MNVDLLIRYYTRTSWVLSGVWVAWAGISWCAYYFADLSEKTLWWGGYWW